MYRSVYFFFFPRASPFLRRSLPRAGQVRERSPGKWRKKTFFLWRDRSLSLSFSIPHPPALTSFFPSHSRKVKHEGFLVRVRAEIISRERSARDRDSEMCKKEEGKTCPPATTPSPPRIASVGMGSPSFRLFRELPRNPSTRGKQSKYRRALTTDDRSGQVQTGRTLLASLLPPPVLSPPPTSPLRESAKSACPPPPSTPLPFTSSLSLLLLFLSSFSFLFLDYRERANASDFQNAKREIAACAVSK